MRKLLIISFTVIILIACTSDHDSYVAYENNQAEITELNQPVNSDIIESPIAKYQPPKNYDKPKYMLQSAIARLQKLDSIDKKNEAYNMLLEFEKEGDKHLAENKLFKAWDKYSMGALSYPSPRIIVKGGDVLMRHYTRNIKIICNCETINDLEESFQSATTVKEFRYKILSRYHLALNLNQHANLNIAESQRLDNKREQALVKKIDCLEDKLNFKGRISDFKIFSECM